LGGLRGTRPGATWLACLDECARRNDLSSSDPPDAQTIKAKLEGLKSEHRDLDEVIDRLIEKPPFDQLQLQRLKKRKLGLKDQILRLESQLIPDIIA
jgi:hypothetical protein